MRPGTSSSAPSDGGTTAMIDPGALAGLVTAIGGGASALLGGIAVWRKAKHEEAAGLNTHFEEHMSRQDKKIEELNERLSKAEARNQILTQYIFQLQLHIQSGGKPPGPPWPVALLPEEFRDTIREDNK